MNPQIPGFQVKNLGLKRNGLLSSIHFIQSSSLCFWANRLPVTIPKTLMIEVLVLSLTQQILKWENLFFAPQPTNSWENAE